MHSSYPPGCQLYAIVFQKFGAAVCTENLIRFDLVTESLIVGRDGRPTA
jgi:hypothetical protein